MAVPGAHIAQQIAQLPPHLQAGLENIAGRARALSEAGYERYPGQRIAPLPQDIITAAALARETGKHAPYLTAAHEHAKSGAQSFPQGYRAYIDPYQEAVVNNIAKQGQRVFKEKIMPELDARFVRLGQYGSSRHAKLAQRAARDMQNEIMSRQEEAMSKGYQQAMQGFQWDKARALEAARTIPEIARQQQLSHLAEVQALRETGAITQEQAQRELDMDYERWLAWKKHPYEMLNFYSSLLQSQPYQPTTYTRAEVAHPARSLHSRDWLGMALRTGQAAPDIYQFGRHLFG